MGVALKPIVIKREITLEDLRGRTLAVDGNLELHQFLALIRKPDGTPLTDSKGDVTSHLVGLLYRTTRLIGDFGIRPVFVFDGEPPVLKRREVEKRREVRERFRREYAEAVAAGDMARAFSKSVMTSRLTGPMIEDAKRLLTLLGIPFVQAPGEAEAQAAFMAKRGDAWAVGSKDYDSLLFGAPRLARSVGIAGKEFLPSKGMFRPVKPELIDAREMLKGLGIDREGLIDLAILIGTDFNPGIKGIGPKTALRLIREYGSIDGLPAETRKKVSGLYGEVRDVFLRPDVTKEYRTDLGRPDEKGLYGFLCNERDFSPERVGVAIERMRGVKRDRGRVIRP